MPTERTTLLPRRAERAARWPHFLHSTTLCTSDNSVAALTLQCFLTGLVNAASFSRTQCWPSFMSGNLITLAISLASFVGQAARRREDHPDGAGFAALSMPSDTASGALTLARLRSSSAALGGFSAGCLIAAHLSFWWNRRRGNTGADGGKPGVLKEKLVLLSVFRAIVTATILLLGTVNERWLLGNNEWILAALSFTMALQAVSTTHLSSAEFSNTVVFTSTFTSFLSDPLFPLVGPPGRRRAACLGTMLLGGLVAQGLIEARKLDARNQPDAKWALCLVAITELALAVVWGTVEGEQKQYAIADDE